MASSASAKLQKRVDACPGPVAGVIGPRACGLAALPVGMRMTHSRGALCSLGLQWQLAAALTTGRRRP